ncbi:MAG: DinB family protein [Fimbriimonadaceae bacterium]|nr:DinB family protein [Fimbriimonadaceae bacterium]QYK55004.1 MAG: DinB family protein [Fimbriimonadaceae bacterium]
MDLSRYTEPLGRTPAMLAAALRGQPDEWLDAKHTPDVFSPREAVAHLLIVEREWGWIFRIKRVMDPKYREDGQDILETDYAQAHTVEDMLREFEAVRRRSLQLLLELGLAESDMERSVHDPEFGTESVRNQLAGWVAHDLYHLGQIYKSYASLYREEIGPYQQHLNLPDFN